MRDWKMTDRITGLTNVFSPLPAAVPPSVPFGQHVFVGWCRSPLHFCTLTVARTHPCIQTDPFHIVQRVICVFIVSLQLPPVSHIRHHRSRNIRGCPDTPIFSEWILDIPGFDSLCLTIQLRQTWSQCFSRQSLLLFIIVLLMQQLAAAAYFQTMVIVQRCEDLWTTPIWKTYLRLLFSIFLPNRHFLDQLISDALFKFGCSFHMQQHERKYSHVNGTFSAVCGSACFSGDNCLPCEELL